MNDDHDDDDLIPAYPPDQAPDFIQIPDQFIPAGKAVHLELASFFIPKAEDHLTYSLEGLPQELSFDPEQAIIHGQAPNVVMNQTFNCKIVATGSLSEYPATVLFDVVVVGSALLDTPEARALFGFEALNVWQTAAHWEVLQFIQQLMNEHFVFIYVCSAENPTTITGKLLSQRKATTGWTIKNYENCLVMAPGDMAFEEYGNRGRLLKTLEELYSIEVPQKGWSAIKLGGSDLENIGKAWVVAKQMGLNIPDKAPQQTAEINFYNLARIGARGPR